MKTLFLKLYCELNDLLKLFIYCFAFVFKCVPPKSQKLKLKPLEAEEDDDDEEDDDIDDDSNK